LGLLMIVKLKNDGGKHAANIVHRQRKRYDRGDGGSKKEITDGSGRTGVAHVQAPTTPHFPKSNISIIWQETTNSSMTAKKWETK